MTRGSLRTETERRERRRFERDSTTAADAGPRARGEWGTGTRRATGALVSSVRPSLDDDDDDAGRRRRAVERSRSG